MNVAECETHASDSEDVAAWLQIEKPKDGPGIFLFTKEFLNSKLVY